MRWGAILGVSLVVAAITLYEWPRMNPDEKKEKATFAVLSTMGWLLTILLVFYPDIPGPSDLIDAIFKPLVKILENQAAFAELMV
ncbi:hypothetical protein [Effusibacillus consociatus]|uniref:Uncharacterized protein n=1 Tax=Effusibacillus consociatus TaxID=1117041 RepID=A0ABV9Q3B0_9BACL